ncbi:TIGR01777 family oxidoreductase [Pedobacter sp.]
MKKFGKIVLTGGSGYLGKVLAKHYSDLATEVVILSRHQIACSANIRCEIWDAKTKGSWVDSLVDADMLINLCGKNVNCRYNEQNKAEIIASRVTPTHLLNAVVSEMPQPPKVWINVTSATIYRHAEDYPQTEANGEIGYGFSIEVCKQWEASFFDVATPKTRKVALRMGIVFGRADGAFPRLLNLVKFGLGGKQGDGKQMVSWVHEQDAALCTQWILENDIMKGVINCTAPNIVSNESLMQNIRNAYGISFGLPCPTWMLSLGAWLIGTETELILKSRWVKPQVLLDSGFKFQYPELPAAVRDLLSLRV